MNGLKIEEGKRCIARNGVIVGPMKASVLAGKFVCSNKILRQSETPGASQVWNKDGSVYQPEDEEKDHEIFGVYPERCTLSDDLAAANAKIAELEGVVSGLNADINKARYTEYFLKSSQQNAVASAAHWRDAYYKLTFKRLSGSGVNVFRGDGVKCFGATGGVVGAVKRDAERDLDRRIDAAFDGMNKLRRELDEARTSTNSRALFFGGFAGFIIVAAAFAAHFIF